MQFGTEVKLCLPIEYILIAEETFFKNVYLQMVRSQPAMCNVHSQQCPRPSWIPGLGKSPGEGNGNPLQYSCLENPMDAGVWPATVCGVTKT